ncbi:MAG: sigma-70 family RNA polymerase sigma factor [Acidimicrobiales bacterium]
MSLIETPLSSSCPRSAAQAAFDRVFQDRYTPMLRLAKEMVDVPSVAEDIVQDSFHKLWQRWDTVDAPAGYLRTSVVNGCVNELRRRRVRREHTHRLVEQTEANTEYLTDALASINERRRQAIVLRYYGDRSMSEIAAAMDIPSGTAKSLISRGLAELRVAFD